MNNLYTNSSVKSYSYEMFGDSNSSDGFESLNLKKNLQAVEQETQPVVEEVPPPEPEVIVPTFSQEELEIAKNLAKEEGIRQGFEEAKRKFEEEKKQQETKINELLTKVSKQLAEMEKASAENRQHFSDEVAQVSFSIAEKICANISEDSVKSEVKSLLEEVVSKCDVTDKVKITVNPRNMAEINDKFTSAAVTSDETLELGDFKVEWSNGYSERSIKQIWKEIRSIVKRHDFLEENNNN